ncbi:hypothetical protein AXG93_2402s1240 [Marchantia polymorpha subsp. ruderalis]|uniref:AB hydrolase-1 domain-containing protein n=1 Tax=Marchantia polymorpha subsp. ruderalis TaxID=1480154 RepID=A0A176VVA9_MARPO|nr:hypothetical protein AXG93_2402s1240 [Marchantia polymorpha subsp. ruderalis]
MAAPGRRSSSAGLSARVVDFVIDEISFSVFAVLDFVDQLLCPVFAVLDSLLEIRSPSCYCRKNVAPGRGSFASPLLSSAKEVGGTGDGVLESWRISSTTVHSYERRRAGTRKLHLVPLLRSLSSEASIDESAVSCSREVPGEAGGSESSSTREHGRVLGRGIGMFSKARSKLQGLSSARSCDENPVVRWSDCGCEKCVSWQANDQLLYVRVDDKEFWASSRGDDDGQIRSAENNVIFLHGFLSSSSFWTESVMPALPQDVRANHRLFAVDILGFGKSPKPLNNSYTLADHVLMIQRSLIQLHGIRKFHLVAHSMGCTVALALAAQFPSAVKSITLLAPPYFPATPGITPGIHTMHQVAPRRIWPLMAFGSAVMSWIPLSSVTDFMQHTHHSAWHLFHNTICNGAQAADHCLQVLLRAGLRVRVIHGTEDAVIPFTQSEKLSGRYPNVLLTPVISANHASIVFGRESELGMDLAEEFSFGESSAKERT